MGGRFHFFLVFLHPWARPSHKKHCVATLKRQSGGDGMGTYGLGRATAFSLEELGKGAPLGPRGQMPGHEGRRGQEAQDLVPSQSCII